MEQTQPPRRRSEQSRRAVLDAASRLLTERGYADVTIEGISAAAGVSKTTIYRWWPTKASIFMELYAELARQPPDTGGIAMDLTVLLKGTFKLYRETAAGVALAGIVAEGQTNASVSRLLRNDFAPSRRHIVSTLLRRAVGRGELPVHLDIELVAEIVLASTWHTVLAGAGELSDQYAQRLVTQILSGVFPGGEPNHVGIKSPKDARDAGPRARAHAQLSAPQALAVAQAAVRAVRRKR